MQHVRLQIPGAGITGHTVQLQLLFYDANFSQSCLDPSLPGPCGVSIDNFVVQHVLATSSRCPVVDVPPAGPVAPGIYFVRLRQAAQGSVSRAVVLR